MKPIKRVLTIAGSDSSGGAGVQGDLKTLMAFGVYGGSAITAITAQNSHGVKSVFPAPPQLVKDQIQTFLEDFGADAIKIGMLCSGAIAEAVAESLQNYEIKNLVTDPVIKSTSKTKLLDDTGFETLRKKIFPLCALVTPNIPEAESFLKHSIDDVTYMKDAAKAIWDLGPKYVLIKGGHLKGDPMDLLYDGTEFIEFKGQRIRSSHTHGTGCALASAIAANLALGRPMVKAVKIAKEYLTLAIKNAPGFGAGHGPLNHNVKPPIGLDG